MLSFSHEQNEDFVIFGIAPKNMAHATKLVQNLPHKYVLGSWKGQVEAACLMPLKDFLPLAKDIGKDEMCYLKLGPLDFKKGRPASIVYFSSGDEVTMGNFSKVPEPPLGGDFTFDPETGFYYTLSYP